MAIRKIGIAGAGIMGSSMARIFAEHDYAVTLYNHQQPRLDKVKEGLGELADKIVFITDLRSLRTMNSSWRIFRSPRMSSMRSTLRSRLS